MKSSLQTVVTQFHSGITTKLFVLTFFFLNYNKTIDFFVKNKVQFFSHALYCFFLISLSVQGVPE